MLAICSALEILPASTYAGSPPTQLNRRNTRTITPSSVGIICQSRRTIYAYICHLRRERRCAPRSLPLPLPSSPRRRLVAGGRGSIGVTSPASRPDVDVLPFGVQDRVLLVPEHLRLSEHVAIAADVEPPGCVGL